jgi:hypothetical protein
MNTQDSSERIDRLYDAIDLVKADKREQAQQALRELIRDYPDFEDAWLWMSVAVDSLDQSAICLDNVLRVNPQNFVAAGALYRMRYSEMEMVKKRSRLRAGRDAAQLLLWLLVVSLTLVLFGIFMRGIALAGARLSLTATPVP